MRKISRKGFIKGLSMCAQFGVFGRSVVAKTYQMNSCINLGLIGLGRMGGQHLRNFLRFPGVRVIAVCDVDTTRRKYY